MNKTFLKFGIIITVIFLFVCSFSIRIKAESSINSTDLTWSIYNPAGYIYHATSTKYTVDKTQNNVANFISQTIVAHNSTSVNLSSVLDSYSQSITIHDLVTYNYNWVFLDWTSLFTGYGSSADYMVQFVVVLDTIPGVTSSALASTYINANFGYYVDTYFTFVAFETATYNEGYQDGYYDGFDDGYVDGYDIGVDNAENGMFDYGSAVSGFTESGSYDYFEGYDDGYTTGSGISIETFNLWPGVWDFMSGLFLIQLFPGLTIGALFGISITIPLAFWMLKFFKKG